MVIAGLLAMLLLEYIATWVSVNTADKKHQHHKNILPVTTQQATTAETTPAAAPESPVHAHDATEGCNKLCKAPHDTAAAAGGPAKPEMSHAHSHTHTHTDSLVPSLAHSHGCRQQPACHSAAVKQQVVCVTMELGCVFHSVVLGLALGVMSASPQLVVTMLVVLSVHQAVEGLAIGCVLAAAQLMSRRKKYGFALVYALTLPVGIAAGLLASHSYDPEAPVAQLVQGVANGLSGGMLLYVSLFSLLAAELNQHDLLHRPLLAAGLMLSVVLGAGVMCVLGIWA